jgi:hypothetical protein
MRIAAEEKNEDESHNPKVGGSNPPPATNLKFLPLNHLKLSAGSLQYHNRLPLPAINPRKAVLPCSDIILEKKSAKV